MVLWVIWFLVAICGFLIEIFNPSFFFMSLGSGAILAGLISLVSPNILLQLLFFLTSAFLVYLWLRNLSPKVFVCDRDKTSKLTLKHKKGILTKEVSANKSGYIKIGKDEWPAISCVDETIPSGKIARVVGIKGAKLVVTKEVEVEEQ